MKYPVGTKILNLEFPTCKNCVFYRPSGIVDDFVSPINKCGNIGTKNVVTGEITYNYADMCRKDEELCGNSGKYYVKEKRMVLKRIRHAIFRPVTIIYAIIAGLIIFSRIL